LSRTIITMKRPFLFQIMLGITSLTSFHVQAQEISSQIQSAYTAFEKDESLRHGIASLQVVDLETGKAIFEKNQNTGLATASTLKVITAITALDLLGADFKFKTQLAYTGHIDAQGILHGNIIIQGAGDPTLAAPRFPETKEENILNKWIYCISNAGIRQIQGTIIGDDRIYGGNQVPGGWIWSDMGNYYGAGLSGLNWRENAAGIDFEVGPVDSQTHIAQTSSDISFLTLINQTRTGKAGTGDQVYAYSAPYSSEVVLTGTYAKDLKKTIEISIPDPAYDAAYQLYLALDSYGIRVDESPQSAFKSGIEIDANVQLLDIHESPRLAEIIYWFNQKSINLYGESILRALTQYYNPKQSGVEIVRQYWKEKLQIDPAALQLVDGSGLSPQNRVSSAAMTQIMSYAQQRPWFAEFYKSLPSYNDMKMKSGTIGGVLGYTGFQKNKNGKTYSFSLLVNNYQGNTSQMRKRMFELLNVLK